MNQIREKNDERLARLLHKQESSSSSNKLASKHNLHKPLIDPLANRQAHNQVSIYFFFAFSKSCMSIKLLFNNSTFLIAKRLKQT